MGWRASGCIAAPATAIWNGSVSLPSVSWSYDMRIHSPTCSLTVGPVCRAQTIMCGTMKASAIMSRCMPTACAGVSDCASFRRSVSLGTTAPVPSTASFATGEMAFWPSVMERM